MKILSHKSTTLSNSTCMWLQFYLHSCTYSFCVYKWFVMSKSGLMFITTQPCSLQQFHTNSCYSTYTSWKIVQGVCKCRPIFNLKALLPMKSTYANTGQGWRNWTWHDKIHKIGDEVKTQTAPDEGEENLIHRTRVRRKLYTLDKGEENWTGQAPKFYVFYHAMRQQRGTQLAIQTRCLQVVSLSAVSWHDKIP